MSVAKVLLEKVQFNPQTLKKLKNERKRHNIGFAFRILFAFSLKSQQDEICCALSVCECSKNTRKRASKRVILSFQYEERAFKDRHNLPIIELLTEPNIPDVLCPCGI